MKQSEFSVWLLFLINTGLQCDRRLISTCFSGVKIISYQVDWPALNRVSEIRTAVERLRFFINFRPKTLIWFSKMFFWYVPLVLKSSNTAKKFLLCAFLLRTPSNLLDWKILANQGASGSYCACSYCAHPLYIPRIFQNGFFRDCLDFPGI